MKFSSPLSIMILSSLTLATAVYSVGYTPATMQSKPSIFQVTLEEPNQLTPEISTEELQAILASGSEPLLDVRSELEYAIAHVPGSINLFEKEVERIQQLYPDRATRLILYCNGPGCGKSKRTSEQLARLGYTNVRRYQLGMPVWRALGGTVQTDLSGLRHIFQSDQSAIFVDARSREQFAQGTIPGAVNIRSGEADRANEDGRLPQWDKGTRVVVVAQSAEEARAVATEIAKKAYWNSSYFGGTFEEAIAPGLFVSLAERDGVASAVALRVRADGSSLYEPVARLDAAQNKFVAIPIDLGQAGDQVFLALYGTGIRFRHSPEAVRVRIGGVEAPVFYAGLTSGRFPLDQLNVLVPRGLAGRGEVEVTAAVNGQPANAVRVNIK